MDKRLGLADGYFLYCPANKDWNYSFLLKGGIYDKQISFFSIIGNIDNFLRM